MVGILGFDGAPANRDLLHRMTDSLRFRGPDCCNIKLHGAVGLGHALLRTTFESEHETQPCSLDGKCWLIADARIDGRAELIGKLKARDRHVFSDVSDPELILHAYAAWGENCVTHLIGDFSFAIWDEPAKRLFCARDPFGVKPFYYSTTGTHFIFGNTLNCLRLHPSVSEDLNEQAVGDFLLFGFNHEQSTTTFADIHRLPGGHRMSVSATGSKIDRYWRAPTDGYVRYRRSDEYVAHFQELFRLAVSDRLRTNRVGVMMSGGLDSTSIAAVAKSVLSNEGRPFTLSAATAVYDQLIPDDERRFAQSAADSLGIPVDFTVADRCALYEGWDVPAHQSPEPVNEPQSKIFKDQLERLASECQVVLTGWDGDAILNESPSVHFSNLFERGRLDQWLLDFVRCYRALGRRPPLGVRTAWNKLVGKSPSRPFTLPKWINQAFSVRVGLPERLDEINNRPTSTHPYRPGAHYALQLPDWADIFESWDAGATGFALEARHPLVDLRLVNFLLAIPPVPFCINKHLLRRAMRGSLPDEVVLRPKSPLSKDPMVALLRNGGGAWLKGHRLLPELSRFVNIEGFLAGLESMDSEEAEAALRPVSLDFWLRGLESINEISESEVSYEHA